MEFVGYENAGLVAVPRRTTRGRSRSSGRAGARAEITFTPAYVEIDATYLVPAGSPIRTVEEVDREGVRIATAARAAYTLFLKRTLRPSLVEADGLPASFDLFVGSRLDALAGLKPRLLDEAAKLSGRTPARGTLHRGAAITGRPHQHAAAAVYLTAFADEIKSSGLLRTIIERHAVLGLSIAAPT